MKWASDRQRKKVMRELGYDRVYIRREAQVAPTEPQPDQPKQPGKKKSHWWSE